MRMRGCCMTTPRNLSPSPPRSRLLTQPSATGPAGERAGVRGREVLGAPFPISPDPSPPLAQSMSKSGCTLTAGERGDRRLDPHSMIQFLDQRPQERLGVGDDADGLDTAAVRELRDG